MKTTYIINNIGALRRGVALAVGVAACGWLSTSQAATYYVATNGNNSANGTSTNTPWQTISKAASIMAAGDTVLIRGGTYRETVNAGASGSSASSRITYAAYPGETPIITGADIYTNWTWDTSASPHAWKTPWSISLPSSSTNSHTTNLTVLRREMIIFNGQVLTAVGTRAELVNGSFWASGADNNPVAIYALFPGNASPTGNTVEAATRSHCFDSSSKTYLAVTGLTFQYACNAYQDLMVNVTGTGQLFAGNVVQWANAGGLYSVGTKCFYTNNIVQNNGQMGFSGGGTSNLWDYNQSIGNNWKGYNANWEGGGGKWSHTFDSTIRHHTAYNNAGPGIWLDVTNVSISIEECLCYSNGTCGIKVELDSHSCTVKNCVAFGSWFNPPYDSKAGVGILVLDAWKCNIVNNTVFNCAGDGIAIDNDGREPGSVKGTNQVINNLVAFNATGGGTSIYYYQGHQVEILGPNLTDEKSHIFNGNIYYNNGVGATFSFSTNVSTSTLSTWQTDTGGQDEHSTNGVNPLLVNSTVYTGFNLTSSSIARGFGVTPPVTVATDYDGNSRPGTGADVGADQYTSVAPPPAPGGLAATPSGTQVSLTWHAASGATSYNVKRSTNSGSGYVTIASPSSTNYVNSGLANGTTYYYVVSSVGSGGEGANSGQVSATTVPGVPSGLTPAPSGTQVSLTWNTASGATSYNVKRSTSSGGEATITNVTTTSYVDAGLAAGTKYYYEVSALNAAGESGNSGEQSATTVPGVPSGLAPTPSGTQVSLTWNTASGATSYNVKRSTSSGGEATITNVTTTSYVDAGLAAGTKYYYEVSALNAAGESGNSGEQSATTVPVVPTGLTATGGTQQVSLSWSTASGANNYNVKRSTTSGGEATVTNVATTSYVDAGLAAGTQYYYEVSALNAAGESGHSGEQSATTAQAGPAICSIPIFQVNAGAGAASPFIADAFYANGIQYSVTSNIDLSGVSSPAPMTVYQSYRYIKTNGNTFTYTFTNLQAGETYNARLHFADLFNTAPGQRQFNVSINGTQVLINFDIIAAAGARFKAVVEEFTTTADASGQIALVFTATTLDSACVNGIEILSEFTGQDIGSVGMPGSASFSNSTYTVNGSGADIWGTNDSFYFASSDWTGDVQLVTYVSSVENTDPSAKAGLMIRQTMASNSMYVDMFVTPAGGVAFQRRTSTSASAVGGYGVAGITPPCWLKLVRSGNLFAGYYSTNGSNWILDAVDTVNMGAAVNVGLEVCAHTNNTLCTATFTNTKVATPWITDHIGSLGLSGSATENPDTGVITVAGSGSDVWGIADEFQYVWQPLAGDGQMVAEVLSVQYTDPNAKAGVMIRETLATNSTYAFMYVGPTNVNSVAFQQRDTTGGSAIGGFPVSGLGAPLWIKVTRTNNIFAGYYSADGINWTQDGTNSAINMATSAYIGMGVCSHSNNVLCTSVFTNVIVTPNY